MEIQDKPAIELTFDEFAVIVKEKDAAGLSFEAYLAGLTKAADDAQRKLELAQAASDMCEATKRRKPRCDRGTKRKKTDAPETPAETAPASEL